MLVDPRWGQVTKADPLELPTLISWLEKQPPKRRFCVKFAPKCGLAQYFKAMGCPDYVEKSAVLGNYYTQFGRVFLGGKYPWSTYGAALKRARAIADQQS